MIILNQRKTAIMECQSLCVAYKGGGEWDIMAESNGELIPVGLFATEGDAASALEQMFMDLGISKTTRVPKAPVHHEAAEEGQDENAKDTHIAERLKKLLAEDEEAGSNGADSGKVEIKILNKK